LPREVPPLSSRKLVRLLERHGAIFVRQRGTSHAIYERWASGERKRAPVVMGEQELSPKYVRLVLGQLGFSDDEIREIFAR